MLRRAVVFGSLALVLFWAVSSVGASPTVSKSQLRTEAARKQLDALLTESPDIPVRALVSFRGEVKPEDALSWANEHELKPLALYHAYITQNNTFRGGYFVRDGETNSQALSNYGERYRSMLVNYAGAVENLLANPPMNEKGEATVNQQSVRQLSTKLADLRAQLSDFDRSGRIPVFGLEVSGTPVRLKSFMRAHDDRTRLAEVLETGQVAVPMLPGE